MLFDAGAKGMVEVDEVVERWRGPAGVIYPRNGEKLSYDGGRFGILEVDQIEYRDDCVMGIVNPDDVYHRITYSNFGKDGCSKVESIPPADMSPEARARQRRKIIERGQMILAQRV